MEKLTSAYLIIVVIAVIIIIIIIIRIKKVKLCPCLIKHYAIKAYGGVEVRLHHS
jgi:hypothetical protein